MGTKTPTKMPVHRKREPKITPMMTLEFVVSTTSPTPNPADRKRIRSHVLRTRSRRPGWKHKSWINSSLPDSQTTPDSAVAVPRNVCSDIALVHFPEVLQPYIVRDLIQYITMLRSGFSPFEACIGVAHKDEQMSVYRMEDPTIFHMALFQVKCYLDGTRGRGGSLSDSTRLHLTKLLQCLQRRLCSEDMATSDLTILIVCALTMAAHDVDDEVGAVKHMVGLGKIVNLRGGIRSLSHNGHRMQRKVCRADLSVALQFGRPPLFFTNSTHYETFLVNTNLIRNVQQHKILPDATALALTTFLKTRLDPRLYNLWQDLAEFTRVTNLACQTKGSLDPSMVNEAMVSTMYRLLHLSYPKPSLNHTLRLGLLAFAASMFLKSRADSRSHQRLAAQLRSAIFEFDEASSGDEVLVGKMPREIRLWLLLVLGFIGLPFVQDLWLVKMVDGVVRESKVTRWADARAMLKDVMWVDELHGPVGRRFVERAVERVKGTSEG